MALADFANQGAYDLARAHDPYGERTVGRAHIVIPLKSSSLPMPQVS
jgi:hypothetical protein